MKRAPEPGRLKTYAAFGLRRYTLQLLTNCFPKHGLNFILERAATVFEIHKRITAVFVDFF